MTYYLIAQSHYYGPKVGPWHLLTYESAQPVTFASRKEAIAAIKHNSLNHNEYACEFKILSDSKNENIRIERRLNSASWKRRPLPVD